MADGEIVRRFQAAPFEEFEALLREHLVGEEAGREAPEAAARLRRSRRVEWVRRMLAFRRPEVAVIVRAARESRVFIFPEERRVLRVAEAALADRYEEGYFDDAVDQAVRLLELYSGVDVLVGVRESDGVVDAWWREAGRR